MFMRKVAILSGLFFILIFKIAAHAEPLISVPQGGLPVLVDGRFSADEWRDAKEINFDVSAKLYVKQFKNHVFIGIRSTGATRYADLFLLDSENRLYNLHASMQIGERLLTDNTWTDKKPAWNWGNHVDWIASEAKLDSTKSKDLPLAMRFFGYDGMEFQIRRSRFPGKWWRVRIEIRDFAGELPDIVFPDKAGRKEIEKWAVLNFR